MKYTFIGSMIPLVFMCIHSLKSLEFYNCIYIAVYIIHLSGRPYFFSVEKWYQLQRCFELCLFMPHKEFVCLLFVFGPQIHKTSLYAFFVYMSDQFLLSTLLIIVIAMHELPVNEKNISFYFYVRMLKNILIFCILFIKSQLLWISFPIIMTITVLYYLFLPKEKIESEYFLNAIPLTYPVPLDIKDAVKHCKTAKALFKKNAV